MAFTTKRGRPSTRHDTSDLGTPELIKKRLYDVTTEAIDMCLNKGLINAEQHWSGIHLRWLYTLRYGVPSVKALDTTHMGGREIVCDNPEWRMEREKEYHEALDAMKSQHIVQAVLALCVFNQRPLFLRQPKRASTLDKAHRIAVRCQMELSQIQTGLNALVKLWCEPISPQKDI